MKKYLFTALVLLGFINGFAQGMFNRAYHDKNEKSFPFLFEIFSDYYFTTDAGFLYKYRNTGGLKLRAGALPAVPLKIYKTNDNKLYMIGRPGFCDVIGVTQENYLCKIDTNGVAVFTSTYTVPQGDDYKTSLQYIDSSYYSFTDSVMWKNSKMGPFISKTNLGLTNISSSLLLQNNNILLSAKQASINSLVEVTPAGATVSIKPFPILLTKLLFYNGQKILGLGTDGKLYKISPNKDLISSSSFTGGLSVTDFATTNDTIYSILTSTFALSNYAVSDTSFNTLSFSSTGTQSITQSAICLNGAKVGILSDGKSSPSGGTQAYFVSLSSINKMGNNNFTHDLELSSIIADSTYYGFNGLIWGNTAFLRAKVKIKNKGNAVINKFKLNCFMFPSITCNIYFYQQQFDQLTLQPGDSITVITNTFVAKWLWPIVVPTSTVQYCFYTTVPNDETDKTFADNEKCGVFSFAVTGLKELTDLEKAIAVFPNPFQNKISIESAIEIQKIELYNIIGMQLKKYVVDDKNFMFDNSELKSGIYFLKIETEKGFVTKKVVKE